MKPELLDHAPPGTVAECNARGWMTNEIFYKWFQKFVQFSGATPSNKVLLLLDGHVSHTQNLDVIDFARQNGVVIICFPPHCTHKLQPADVTFMKPLSVYYDQAATAWLRSHPGRVITTFQISEIFGKAYVQAATMTTAINGFKKCGIWPYNQNNFSDADFITAETTNIQVAENQQTETVEQPAQEDVVQNLEAEIVPTADVQQSLSSIIERDFQSGSIATTPSRPTGDAVSPSIIQPSTSTQFEDCSVQALAHNISSLIYSTPVASTSMARETTTCLIFQLLTFHWMFQESQEITTTPYKKDVENRAHSKKCANPNDPRLKKNAKKTKEVKTKASKKTVQEDTICFYCEDINNTYLKSQERWVARCVDAGLIQLVLV